MNLKERISDPRRVNGVGVRRLVERGIRRFFDAEGFEEVRTPLLVPSPGHETHIHPFRVGKSAWLPTSPEFAMKKLLVGGMEKIYQICPAFRQEPFSRTHRPEFTLLEWYRAHGTLDDLMNDVESLFLRLARERSGSSQIQFGETRIDVSNGWPRKTVRELFLDHANVDLCASDSLEKMRARLKELSLPLQNDENWDDLYFKVWLNCVEPEFDKSRPLFVTHFPLSQAAWARKVLDQEGNPWAERFEIFMGGLELANAYQELTDPDEQRNRIETCIANRKKIYPEGKGHPELDESFIEALKQGLPESAGIALGVDRLVMLFANEHDIDLTQWLDPVEI